MTAANLLHLEYFNCLQKPKKVDVLKWKLTFTISIYLLLFLGSAAGRRSGPAPPQPVGRFYASRFPASGRISPRAVKKRRLGESLRVPMARGRRPSKGRGNGGGGGVGRTDGDRGRPLTVARPPGLNARPAPAAVGFRTARPLVPPRMRGRRGAEGSGGGGARARPFEGGGGCGYLAPAPRSEGWVAAEAAEGEPRWVAGGGGKGARLWVFCEGLSRRRSSYGRSPEVKPACKRSGARSDRFPRRFPVSLRGWAALGLPPARPAEEGDPPPPAATSVLGQCSGVTYRPLLASSLSAFLSL